MVATKLTVVVLLFGMALAAPAEAPAGDLQADAQTNVQAAQVPPRPQINWGKCPQLQPTESERQQKALVIDQCLEKVPLPNIENATQEDVQKHREDVTTCALHTEGWFNEKGRYRFDRARSEILNKQLAKDVESVVLSKHDECKTESEEKFAQQYVSQVQLYQACMDYHISQICGIQIAQPAPPQGAPHQG
ncbi:uncharacterized protein LOC135368352 [Ornithodoros turicata]|uniref:Putative secreted protein n=1 Tax=Ornithodoros turicata TaxID=34597 RepID=A0A2R5LN41_9ACAR